MNHKLKTHPEYFRAIVSGDRNFEVRHNDRGYQKGDTLTLQEWRPDKGGHTGYEVTREITHVLKEHQGISPGFAVLSLKRTGTMENNIFVEQ